MGLSRLLSELELDTSNSARSCLFISSNSWSCESLGSLGLYGIFFLVVSGMSIGINLQGIGL